MDAIDASVRVKMHFKVNGESVALTLDAAHVVA